MLVLLPLFIVLVAFAAFSGEREQGTLRQLMSLGVAKRDLFLGKAAGVAGALALVVIPVTVAGVAALALTSEFGSPLHDLSRAALLAVTYFVYFAIVIAVALGVSARLRSSRLALLALLSLWFVNTLMAPRVATDVAAALHPTPSALQFQAAIEKDLADPDELNRRLEAKRQALMRAHKVTSMDAVPVNFSGISLQTGEERGNDVFDRHFGALYDIYDRQGHVMTLAGVLAPQLPVRALSMALAGTDIAHHRAFVGAAEAYRRNIQVVLNNDIAEHAKPGVVYTAGRELWDRIPEFSYEPPATAAVLGQQRWSLLVLAGWLLAAGWFGVRSVSRLAID